MAEGRNGVSWWGEWIQTAKEKANSSLDFVKKDLVEFTSIMQNDTTRVADTVKSRITHENATVATKKVRDGVSNLIGGISKALTINETEDADHNAKKTSSHQPIFDKAKACLHAIQLDPGTYYNLPSGPPEEFQKWLEDFNLECKKGEISDLLVNSADVRSLYTQMVPSQVAHADFWQRYFYKVYQLEQDEKRKAALKKRAETMKEDIKWDDDEWVDMAGPSSPTSPPGEFFKLVAPLATALRTTAEDEVEVLRVTSKGVEPIECVDEDKERTNILGQKDMEPTKTNVNKQENINGQDTVEILKDYNPGSGDQSLIEKQKGSKTPDNINVDKELKLEEKVDNGNSSMKPIEVKPEPVVTVKPETSTQRIEKRETADIDESLPTIKVCDDSKSEDLTVVSTLPVTDSVDTKSKQSLISSPVEKAVNDANDSKCSLNGSPDEVKTKDKGDIVLVGSDRTTPSSDTNKESSIDEDWEKEFDIDLPEEDLQVDKEASKYLADENLIHKISEQVEFEYEDDWESWD